MTRSESGGDTYSLNNQGNISGSQIAVGRDIEQDQDVHEGGTGAGETEPVTLEQVLEALRAQIDAKAPAPKKGAALERVQELEEAVTTPVPDLTTMEYVRNWFLKNVPGLAGAVTSVLINPILGKVVEAAGDGCVAEFERRFGELRGGAGGDSA